MINNYSTIKSKADVIVFKMKAQDAAVFFDREFSRILKGFRRKNNPASFYLENPGYDIYAKKFQELPNNNWALRNLNIHGFNVKEPVTMETDSIVQVIFFKTKKGMDAVKNAFGGVKGFCLMISDTFRANKETQKYADMVLVHDALHKNAKELLYAHKLNTLQNSRMQSLLKGLEIKEVNYVPKLRIHKPKDVKSKSF